eukprot:1834704-Pyramimonas_sp.AAC.1
MSKGAGRMTGGQRGERIGTQRWRTIARRMDRACVLPQRTPPLAPILQNSFTALGPADFCAQRR